MFKRTIFSLSSGVLGLRSYFLCLVSCVLCLGSVVLSAEEPKASTASALGFSQTTSPTGFIKGHSWGWVGSKGQYLGDEPVDSMKKLAETNANWICISFAGEMMTANDTNIIWAR